MPRRLLEIDPPFGGLHRRFDLQYREPYTTPDCVNVRPVDDTDGKRRLSQRPGLERVFAGQIGTDASRRINMLARMNIGTSSDEARSVVRDNFDEFLTSDFPGESLLWSKMSDGRADAVVRVEDELLFTTVTNATVHPAYVLATTGIDTSSLYRMQATVSKWLGRYSTVATFYLGMDDDDPDYASGGVKVDVRLNTNTSVTTLVVREVTISSSSGGELANAIANIDGSSLGDTSDVSVLVNGSTITVMVAGVTVLTHTLSSMPTGSRVGLGLRGFTGYAAIDSFLLSYVPSSPDSAENPVSRIVVASAAGKLYRERTDGVFEEITMNGTLLDGDLAAAEVEGKLYIADRGDELDSGDCTVAADGELVPTGTYDFSDVIAGWHAVEVIDPDGEFTGTYGITSNLGTSLMLTDWQSLEAPMADCTYRIVVTPKVFDPQTDTCVPLVSAQYDATLTPGRPGWPKGLVPTGNTMAMRYMDCLALAEGRVWQISRQGDPADWDYLPTDPDDPGRAVYGPGTTDAIVPEPITAIIAHSDDYMLFASMEALYLLRGHPAAGGRLDTLSHAVGCVGRYAWCELPDGGTAILSRDGLYAVAAGGSRPQPLSREPLPREMLNLDGQPEPVNLAYDTQNRGVEIWWGRLGYWWDAEDGGFWPQQIPADLKVTRLLRYIGQNPERSGVLFGGTDGRIRALRRGLARDDGSAITSYCVMGPIRLAQDDFEGLIAELDGVLGEASGSLTFEVRTADTFEKSIDLSRASQYTGTWVASRNYRHRPRLRGQAFSLKVCGVEGEPWSFVRCGCGIEQAGRLRML